MEGGSRTRAMYERLPLNTASVLNLQTFINTDSWISTPYFKSSEKASRMLDLYVQGRNSMF